MLAEPGPIVGLVLAAGRGERLGGRPKCLLQLDGVPLIRRLISAMHGAGIHDVIVVTGHHAAQVEPALSGANVRVVRNPTPDAGQTSSLRRGLAVLNTQPQAQAIMVALADQPGLDAQDLSDLRAAWQARPAGADVLFPQVNGKRGNPVMLSASVCADLLAAPHDVGARQWQAAHPQRVAPFVTTNEHYRLDVDTDDDLARFQRETGRALVWPPEVSASPRGR